MSKAALKIPEFQNSPKTAVPFVVPSSKFRRKTNYGRGWHHNTRYAGYGPHWRRGNNQAKTNGWNSKNRIEHRKEILTKAFKIHKTHQKELARCLLANSWQAGDYYIAPYEAFYSIARLLFTLSEAAKPFHWNMVNESLNRCPEIVTESIGIHLQHYFYAEGFFAYQVNGEFNQFAADLGDLAQFMRNWIWTETEE